MLSEIRAPGGALIAAGALMLAGIFSTRHMTLSLGVSAALYLSYGAARLPSLSFDGLPDQTLIAATVFEILIGYLSLFALVRLRNSSRGIG